MIISLNLKLKIAKFIFKTKLMRGVMKEILKNIILEFYKDELPPLFKRNLRKDRKAIK